MAIRSSSGPPSASRTRCTPRRKSILMSNSSRRPAPRPPPIWESTTVMTWSRYDSDQSSCAPDVWLTGTVYHWGPYYARQVKAARDGTWKSDNYYGSIADGMIGLATFGKSVPASVQTQINNKMDALKNRSFYEFTGPLKDQSGAVHVPAGKKLTVDELYGMDWFVQGVIGSPKGG